MFHKNASATVYCHTNWKIIMSLHCFFGLTVRITLVMMTIGLPFIWFNFFFFLKVPNKGGIKTLFLVKRKDVSLPFTLLILPPPQFSEPFKIESSHTYASEASFEKKCNFDQQLTGLRP